MLLLLLLKIEQKRNLGWSEDEFCRDLMVSGNTDSEDAGMKLLKQDIICQQHIKSPVVAICHKSWGSRPPLSLLQCSSLPLHLMDSPKVWREPGHPLPNSLMQFIQSNNHIQEPCYRRENRAMPLYISIGIQFYNDIVRFLCHSTHFLLVFVCRLQWIICQKLSDKYKKEPVKSHS